MIKIKNNYDLDGLRGVLYLMFLGRKTYTNHFQKTLKKLNIIKDTANCTQSLSILRKTGYVEDKEQNLTAPGRPFYRTSNPEAFFNTLKETKVIFTEKEIEIMEQLVKMIANGKTEEVDPLDFFPEYVVRSGIRKKDIKKLRWTQLFADYINFMFSIFFQSLSKIDDSPDYLEFHNTFLEGIVPGNMLREQRATKKSLTLATENVDLEIIKNIKNSLTIKQEKAFTLKLLYVGFVSIGTPNFMIKIFINRIKQTIA